LRVVNPVNPANVLVNPDNLANRRAGLAQGVVG